MDAWQDIRLIAHRCGGALAPENSLAGLHAAHACGYRAVEFDVMLSGDGTPVLIHDETVDRTTNGSGQVPQMSDDALFALSLAKGAHAAFVDERIPRFADAARQCLALGLLANVEIKPAEGFERETAASVAAMSRALWQGAIAPGGGTPALPLLSSFSETALEVARDLAPELPRALLVEWVPADWQARIDRLGCIALHCSARQPGWGWLAQARARGLVVRCYTVNRPGQAARLFARGVDAVFTDALQELVPVVDAS